MAVFPRPSGPRALWRDFCEFIATKNRHRVLFGALAVALPALLIAGFLHDSKREPRKPEMWFMPSWPADRSDAVIIAQNKADQIKRDKLLAEKRAAFQRVAKQLGIE